MPRDPDTGKRYPYTREGRAAFERDQRRKKKGKRKKGKRRGKRRPGRDPRAAEVLTGGDEGMMALVEEAKRRKE